MDLTAWVGCTAHLAAMMLTMAALRRLLLIAHLMKNALGSDIVQGELVPAGAMQYMASLQDSAGEHICGASLVSKSYVLTAAHCNDYAITQVVIGSHNLRNSNTITRSIVQTWKHPNYDGIAHGNDLMLLKLSAEVEIGANVQLLPLAKHGTKIEGGQRCQVAGWGKTGTNSAGVYELRRVEVAVVKRDVCKRQWPQLSRDAICAGGNSRFGFCQGDSGGPLVCSGVGVGVVSYNRDKYCTYPDRPNVYVSISQHLDWINAIIS